MLDATNEWLSNMDKGLINCVTFLDFSKAFDTVDHTTLLHKLSLYGVAENSLAWFKSYLTNRQQRSFDVWCSSGIYSRPVIVPDLHKWSA